MKKIPVKTISIIAKKVNFQSLSKQEIDESDIYRHVTSTK